jgi:hypothetical protein
MAGTATAESSLTYGSVPDGPVLPSQVAALHPPETGESRLMLEVLAKAFEDISFIRWPFVYEDLHAFFFGKYEGPFSFSHICEVLGFDRTRMREAAAAFSLGGEVNVTTVETQIAEH